MAARGGDLVHAPDRPCVHRGIHVVKGKLVRWYLAVGVHVPLTEEEQQLLLGKMGVDAREGDHVEGKVPPRKPGVREHS